ncbi:uncharacterized protein LOC126716423 [Quercus robur]|uniref:uncharacterized protein LOC126716423 n=1 Tax=Quercus robur TaxID=38942 RepID=UPI0021635C8F|nr:uncharacterized protein LOC126716423 [Quercus robur]
MPSITVVIQENLHWTLAMSRMNGVQVPNGTSPEDLLAYCQSRAHMFERDDWADKRFTPGRAMLLNIRSNFQTLFCLRYLMRIRRWNNLTRRVLRQYQIRHSRALNAFVASISEFVNWATMLHYYLTHDESIVLVLTGFCDYKVF